MGDNRALVTSVDSFGTVDSVLSAESIGMGSNWNKQFIVIICDISGKKQAHALFDENLKNALSSQIDVLLTTTRAKLQQSKKTHALGATLKPHFVPKDIIINANKDFGKNIDKAASKNDREKTVDQMLLDADSLGASDIHATVGKQSKISFRINGELEMYGHVRDQDELHSVISVLISNMAAKDGSIKNDEFKPEEQEDAVMYRDLEGKRFGLRITTHPTTSDNRCYHMVMRVLGDQNSYAQRIPFEELGFMFDQPARIRQALRGKGMVMTVGETNSGKSVSQQNYLMLVNEQTNNTSAIYSMENPIERQIQGVVQFNLNDSDAVKKDQAESVSDVLIKYFMRADPNTLALAEIRDLMTAQAAQKLSQTGHKVFATLHCESPFDVFERLVGLGCDHHTLASGEILGAVVSQKLLKKICPDCSHSIHTAPHISEKQMIAIEQICGMGLGHRVGQLRFRNTKSKQRCKNPKCRNGLIGRQLIAECVNITPEIMQPLATGNKLESKRVWLEDNNFTKFDCALSALLLGLVDCEDVIDEIGNINTTHSMRADMKIAHPEVVYA